MTKKPLEIAADIVQTQVGSSTMTAAEIAFSLRTVFQTLRESQRSDAKGTPFLPPVIPEEAEAGKSESL